MVNIIKWKVLIPLDHRQHSSIHLMLKELELSIFVQIILSNQQGFYMSAKEKITNLFHVLQYNNHGDDNNNNRTKQQRKTRLYCHLGVTDDKTSLSFVIKI